MYRENTGGCIYDLGVGKDFLHRTQNPKHERNQILGEDIHNTHI